MTLALLLVPLLCCTFGALSLEVSQSMSVAEEQDVGTYVGTVGKGVVGSPQPPYSSVTAMEISGKNDFRVDTQSGQIFTKARLDRERKALYRVLVHRAGVGSVIVVIRVTDINDHAPEFTNVQDGGVLRLRVLEHRATLMTLGSAVDKDEGINGTVAYDIHSGNINQTFELVTRRLSHGERVAELRPAVELDYEKHSSYQLVVRATDGGQPPRWSDLHVQLDVIDANDHAPTFTEDEYVVDVPENTTVGSRIIQVSASDVDAGELGRVTYSLEDNVSEFEIDINDGVIRLRKSLDFELVRLASLVVVARDNGIQPQQNTALVTVRVLNVNDNAPVVVANRLPNVWNRPSVAANELHPQIARDYAVVGAAILRLSITDPDVESPRGIGSAADNITDRIDDEQNFRLTRRGRYSVVTIAKQLSESTYQFSYTATDSGRPPLSTHRSVMLFVDSGNSTDAAGHGGMTFTSNSYIAAVVEDAPVGHELLRVQLRDVNVLVSFSSNSDLLDVDPATGVVRLARPLNCRDRINHTSVITAVIAAPISLSTSTYVMLRVEPVNTQAPFFHNSSFYATVPEDAAIGYCFFKVAAEDADCESLGRVAYSFSRPEVAFTVNADSGAICVREPIGHSGATGHFRSLIVSATDGGSRSSYAQVFVDVEDASRSPPPPPTFFSADVSTSLGVPSPRARHVAVVRVRASSSPVTYAIEAGDRDGTFRIDASSGLIVLAKDVSSPSTFDLSVGATDRTGQSSIAKVKVTFSRGGKTFARNVYRWMVAENSDDEATEVGELGISGSARLVVSSGNEDGKFALDQVSKVMTTTSSLDREARGEYVLTVDALGDTWTASTQVLIEVLDENDNAPDFGVSSVELTVPENATVGSVVYRARARDPDADSNGAISYAVTRGDHVVRVNAQTGVVTLRRGLDHELLRTVTCVLEARDGGDRSASLTLRLLVADCNDNVPVFRSARWDVEVNAATPANVAIAEIAATDADDGRNGRVFVSLASHVEYFTLRAGAVYTRRSLADAPSVLLVSLLAEDAGRPSLRSNATLVVHVSNHSDDYLFREDHFRFYVSEDARPASLIGTVELSRHEERATFELDDSTGFFSLSPSGALQTTRSLDRETRDSFALRARVSVSSVPPRVASVPVTVVLLDVNDERPDCSSSLDGAEPLAVDENRPRGTVVATVVCKDGDAGLNGTVTYAMTHDAFAVDELTGAIYTRTVLDHESRPNHTATLVARDSGSPPLTTQVDVVVYVNDKPDTEIRFHQSEVRLFVPENATVGSVVGSVRSEKDGDVSETRFTLIGGDVFGTFALSSDGTLRLNALVDHEAVAVHRLDVLVASPTVATRTARRAVVEVGDVNDCAPEFRDALVRIDVAEDTSVGSLVHRLVAVDRDSGRNAELSFRVVEPSGDAATYFRCEPTTGALRLSRSLLRAAAVVPKARQPVVLHVEATDSGSPGRSAQQVVVVNVLDVNDHAPEFVGATPELRLPEGALVGSPVTYVLARDDDDDVAGNAAVRYQLDSPNFRVDHRTGLLRVSGPLDGSAVPASQRLRIWAHDLGLPRRKSSRDVVVHVLPGHERAPRFRKSVYESRIREDVPPGSVVATVAVVRRHQQDVNLRFLLPSAEPGAVFFQIDERSGRISTKKPLDAESQATHNFSVIAHDVSSGSFASCVVSVRLDDVNDEDPVVTSTEQLVLRENTPMTSFHRIVAVDGDVTSVLSYELVSSSGGAGHFRVDAQTGDVSCGPLDRETRSSHELLFHVRDRSERVGSTRLVVNVLDDNDNAPKFAHPELLVTVPEDAEPGTSVTRVSATDADVGSNGLVLYQLGGGEDFAIDAATGVVTVADHAKLDRERTAFYRLRILAFDSGNHTVHSATTFVNVSISDVNESPPVFRSYPFTATVPTGLAAGSSVASVRADDADSGTSDILYGTSSDAFTVDAVSGVIRNVETLQRSSTYDVLVTATDGKYVTTGLVAVYVGTPELPAPLSFSRSQFRVELPEAAAPGQTVLSFDVPDAVGFDVKRGNSDGAFSISQDGALRVANVALDREARARTLTIQALAADGVRRGFAEVIMTVAARNEYAPEFAQHEFTVAVHEERPAGTFVFRLHARDRDSSRVGYRLRGSKHGALFRVAGEQLQTAVKLDREIARAHRLVVEALDDGSPVLTSTCNVLVRVLDVNDNTPMFRSYPPVVLSESSQVGTIVRRVTANDLDLQPALDYALVGDTSDFVIERTTGLLRQARPLDREKRDRYVLNVTVSDGSNRAETSLRVHVRDVNDNVPRFTSPVYDVDVPRDVSSAGTAVGAVLAHDDDEHNSVSYALVASPLSASLRINATSGVLYATGAPPGDGFVTATATDDGEPARSGLATVLVRVVEPAPRAPSFRASAYEFVVPEGAAAGTSVGRVSATGNDSVYSVDSTANGLFGVEPLTGDMFVVAPLDRETTTDVRFLVRVHRARAPLRNATATVRVRVADVNDNAPTFVDTKRSVRLAEDAAPGSLVATVTALDVDSQPNATLRYDLVSAHRGLFGMERSSGVVRLRGKLDAETTRRHRLVVRASDDANNSAFSVLDVHVDDVDEYEPTFFTKTYNTTLSAARLPKDVVVIVARAVDRDAESSLRYRLTAHDGLSGLWVDAVSGHVRTTSPLRPGAFRFFVSATDGQRFAGDLQVNVAVAPEVRPRFPSDGFAFDVPANARVGDRVGTVAVKHGAEHVWYSLVDDPATEDPATDDPATDEDDNGPYFAIDRTSGDVVVLRDLRRRRRRRRSADVRARREVVVTKTSPTTAEPGAFGSTTIRLRAVASTPLGEYDVATAVILVNRTCAGCGDADAAADFTGTSLVLVIVFAVIAVVLVAVIAVMYVRGRDRRKRQPDELHSYPSSYDGMDVSTAPLGPPAYNDLRDRCNDVTGIDQTNVSERSSGHGSAEDVDREIRMINATPTSVGSLRLPDSGIHDDDDDAASVHNHQQYLARLGIDASQLRPAAHVRNSSAPAPHPAAPPPPSSSSSSLLSAAAPAGVYASVAALLRAKDGSEFLTAARDRRKRTHQRRGGGDGGDEDETDVPPAESLSSVTNNEELANGSYNWDYLLDWGPQYQPLADVFSEIARLKDEHEVKNVPRARREHADGRVGPPPPPPPPLITDAPPPHSRRAPPSVVYASSASPLSPSFAPALSPLGVHSSPLVVHPPVASAGTTNHASPATSNRSGASSSASSGRLGRIPPLPVRNPPVLPPWSVGIPEERATVEDGEASSSARRPTENGRHDGRAAEHATKRRATNAYVLDGQKAANGSVCSEQEIQI